MPTVTQLDQPHHIFAERRVARRRRLMLRSTFRLRGRFETFDITVRDISSTGLQGSTPNAPFAGGKIELDLCNIGMVPAIVVWSGAGRMGVKFEHVIDPDAVQMKITGSYGIYMPPPVTGLRAI